MNKIFRAAIIGTGRIAGSIDDELLYRVDPTELTGPSRHIGLYLVFPVNHAAAYRTTPGFELVAAANRNSTKLRAFGERWDVQALYSDFREMLRQQQPDVVSICTRTPDKPEVILATAEAGVKAIVVEKALASSMAEADAILRACERNNVFVAMNHPYRFSPLIREAKALIDRGRIGTLGTVMAYDSGAMIHIGTHTFDLLRFWAGDVVQVQAHVPNYKLGEDLPAHGTLQFAKDVTGFFDHVHGVRQGYEARGSEGYLTASALVGDGWLYGLTPLYEGSHKYWSRQTMEPIEGSPHTLSPTQRLLSELYETLSTGAPFVSTGWDGAAALEIGLACSVSHIAGGPVSLPLSDRSFRVHNL